MTILNTNIDLWSRPAREIPLSDVLAFLEQRHAEHVRLDYKADFSSKDATKELANDLAAFANTQGGVLLIGVKEDQSSGKARPILPVKGRKRKKATENPEVRIRDVALNPIHIYPPARLDVQVYPMSDDRELILVQVVADDEIHWTEEGSGFYIRDHDRCLPVRGKNEQLELLRNRREKIHQLKEQLLKDAFRRYNWAVFGNNNEDPTPYRIPQILVSTIPRTPTKTLVAVNELYPLILKHQIKYEGINFPEGRKVVSGMEQVQIVQPHDKDEIPFRSFEACTNGLLFFGRQIGDEEDTHGISKATFPDHEILVNLIRFLLFVRRFYREVGYLGLVDFRLQIVVPHNGAHFKFQGRMCECTPSPGISITKEFGLFEFGRDLQLEFLVDIYKKLTWAGGIGIEIRDETLKSKVEYLLPKDAEVAHVAEGIAGAEVSVK